MSVRSELLAAPILAVLALWCFGSGMQGFFVSDDYLMLNFAQALRQVPPLEALGELLASDHYRSLDIKVYRPLWVLSFVVQSAVSGPNYASYIAADILLHVMNGLLLVSVLQVVTGRRFTAVLGGALFVVGGIQADAVLWLVSRYALMAAFFVLLAFRLALAGRRVAAFVATVLALLSGEQGVVAVPLVALAAAWRAGSGADWRTWLRAGLRALWPLLVLFAVYLLWRKQVLGVFLGGYRGGERASIFSAWWVESRVTLLDAMVAPAHPLYIAAGTRTALRLLAGLLLAAVLVTAWRRTTRRGRDGDALLWIWLLLVFVPIFKVGIDPATLRDSRLLYQPVMVWSALVALGSERICTWLGTPARAHVARSVLGVGLVAVQVALLLANRQPWIEAPRISARIHRELEPRLRAETERPLAITDIPGIHDGAYLGLAGNEMMFTPWFLGFTPTRPLRAYVDNELDREAKLETRRLVEDLDEYRSATPPLPPIELVSVAPDGAVQEIPVRPPTPVDAGGGIELRAGHASPRRLEVGGRLNVALRLRNRSGQEQQRVLEFRRDGRVYGMLPITIPAGDPVSVGRSFAATPPLVPGRYEVVFGGAAIAEVELVPSRR